MKKYLSTIVSIVLILGAFGGFCTYNEIRYASAKDMVQTKGDVEQTKQSVEYMREYNFLRYMRDDLRNIKISCGKKCTSAQQIEIDDLNQDIELQKEKVKKLQGNTTKQIN
jgi:uncharacterized protein YxeA